MNINYDSSALEAALKAIIKEIGVSDKVYTNRPKAADNATDFVVVKVSGNIEDTSCYATCRVYIILFAKDVNNLKNAKKLTSMYKKLVESFPTSYEGYEFDPNATILPDSPDDFGYHARVINFKTLIKTI